MNLLNISFVMLIALGLWLFIYGLQKKSQLSMLCGGIAFLAPLFYFIGWVPFLPFVPPLAFVISYLGKKRAEHA